MKDTTRIPRRIEKFNPYIANTNAYLLAGTPTNATRLGLLPAEVTQWTVYATTWPPLYLTYSDKKKSRTTLGKDQLKSIIYQAVDYDQKHHILDRIAASPNVTLADLETFNIKKGILPNQIRTVSLKSIGEPVVASVQSLGSGIFAIKCHHSTGTRASIFEEADTLQYAYLIGDKAPASADDPGLTKEVSTKATFTLKIGAGFTEQHLYIYFRWYNTVHPDLAGPWSNLITILIT